MSEFADSFFSMILDIQQDLPDLISPEIYVINYYGLSRSEIQGATARSQVAKVPKDVINWINCWNIGEEYVVHRSMRVVYLERQKCWRPFWRFCCHFGAYCEGLRNPIAICGSMIRWVSYSTKG